ncbi:MAG: hypothetical protein GY822_00145 [Deltaproteobacteria bacterium]|nr:hypothetical protein [Deltaproteobacteria bacterium]
MLCFTAIFAACPAPTDPVDLTEPSIGEPDVDAACSQNADCDVGEVCRAEQCEALCDSNDDCEGQTCNASGKCVECLTNASCDVDERCFEGV